MARVSEVFACAAAGLAVLLLSGCDTASATGTQETVQASQKPSVSKPDETAVPSSSPNPTLTVAPARAVNDPEATSTLARSLIDLTSQITLLLYGSGHRFPVDVDEILYDPMRKMPLAASPGQTISVAYVDVNSGEALTTEQVMVRETFDGIEPRLCGYTEGMNGSYVTGIVGSFLQPVYVPDSDRCSTAFTTVRGQVVEWRSADAVFTFTVNDLPESLVTAAPGEHHAR